MEKGCGSGAFYKMRHSKFGDVQYVGTELNEDAFKEANKRRIPVKKVDIVEFAKNGLIISTRFVLSRFWSILQKHYKSLPLRLRHIDHQSLRFDLVDCYGGI